jgi:hypothetical protein
VCAHASECSSSLVYQPVDESATLLGSGKSVRVGCLNSQMNISCRGRGVDGGRLLQVFKGGAWKAARDGAVAASAGRRFQSGMVRGKKVIWRYCVLLEGTSLCSGWDFLVL